MMMLMTIMMMMTKMLGWDLASSCYFTFVTLTTIGFGNIIIIMVIIIITINFIIIVIVIIIVRFGDMVPGQNDMGSGGMGLEQIAKMTVIILQDMTWYDLI